CTVGFQLLPFGGEGGDPSFLGWPLAAPFRVRQRVVGMIGGAWRGVELMQRVDEEAALAQDLDPLAVTGVELYPPRSGQAAGVALRVEQFAAGRAVRSGGAHGGQDGGGGGHHPAAAPEQARGV